MVVMERTIKKGRKKNPLTKTVKKINQVGGIVIDVNDDIVPTYKSIVSHGKENDPNVKAILKLYTKENMGVKLDEFKKNISKLLTYSGDNRLLKVISENTLKAKVSGMLNENYYQKNNPSEKDMKQIIDHIMKEAAKKAAKEKPKREEEARAAAAAILREAEAKRRAETVKLTKFLEQEKIAKAKAEAEAKAKRITDEKRQKIEDTILSEEREKKYNTPTKNLHERMSDIYSKLIDYGIHDDSEIKDILKLYPEKNETIIAEKDVAYQLQHTLNQIDTYKIAAQNFRFRNDDNYNKSSNYDKTIMEKIKEMENIDPNVKSRDINDMFYKYGRVNDRMKSKDNSKNANNIINRQARIFNNDDEYVSKKEDDALENKITNRLRAEAEAAEEARLKAEAEAAEEARLKAEAEAAEVARLKAEAEAAEVARLKAEAEAAEEARLKAEAEAAEVARLKAEAEAAEVARLKAEAEAAEVARLKAEAEAAEEARLKAEAEAAEEARLKAERLEAERVEAERLEAERLEAERLEAERLEAERLEAEKARLKAIADLPPIDYRLTGKIGNTSKALYTNRIWAREQLEKNTKHATYINYLYNKEKFNPPEDIPDDVIQKNEVGFDLDFNGNAGHVLSQTVPNDKDKWALIYTDVNYIDNGGTKTGNYYRKIYSVSQHNY